MIQYGHIIVKQRNNCYQSPQRGHLSIFKVGDRAIRIIGHGDGDVSVDAPFKRLNFRDKQKHCKVSKVQT